MPTTTRLAMRQKLLRRIDFPAFPVTSTTTSIGSTTTLNDSILAPAAESDDFAGDWIYIAEAVTSPGTGPAVGEIARVTDADFSGSTSQLTLAPAMTQTIQTGTDYEIHRRYHPSILHQVIDDVLDELEHPIILPLTLVTDGDMETSGTSDWTAAATTGTAPTLGKGTTNVLHGRQSLTITANADATNSFAQSATINLPPSTEVLCAADVFITSGDSARLVLRDLTSSPNVDIETATSAITGWVHLEFKVTTGTAVEEVQLWLESPAASDVTYWDNAILLPTKQTSFTYPGSLEFSDELIKVFYFPRGTGLSATTDDFAFKLQEKNSTFWGHAQVERDETGVVPYRVELLTSPITHPLWVDGRIDYPAYAGANAAALDADTTVAPKELVVELAYAKLLDMQADAAFDDGDREKGGELRDRAAVVRVNVAREYRGFRTSNTIVHGAKR